MLTVRHIDCAGPSAIGVELSNPPDKKYPQAKRNQNQTGSSFCQACQKTPSKTAAQSNCSKCQPTLIDHCNDKMDRRHEQGLNNCRTGGIDKLR